MHEMFRVLGQQMGLERVRGILEESIDVYLNVAIKEIVSNIVKSNVQTVYKDKITIQDNPISPVNGVSTLYKELETIANIPSGYTIDVVIPNVQYIFGFSVSYPGITNFKQCRFVESDRIGITLDDYCSRPSKKYPIITVVNVDEQSDVYTFRIYSSKGIIEKLFLKLMLLQVLLQVLHWKMFNIFSVLVFLILAKQLTNNVDLLNRTELILL